MAEDYKGQAQDLKTISSLTAQIATNEERIAKSSGKSAENLKLKNAAAQKALKAVKTEEKILRSVNKTAMAIPEAFGDGVEKISEMASNIPLVGKSLSKFIEARGGKATEALSRMAEGFTGAFTNRFQRMLDVTGDFSKSFTAGMKAGMGAVKQVAARVGGLGKLFAGLGIIAILAAAFAGFQKLDAAATAFRENTGLLNSQTKQLSENIRQVSMSTAELGASSEDVANAAAEFTNAFSGLAQPSKEILESSIALEKNFGVAAADSAKLNQMFQSIGGLSAEAAQHQVAFTTQLAAAAGVAPSKVIKDIAENSEAASMHFSGSVEDLTKSAVQAARLGTSIGQAAKVAEGLLDFNNSINAELEASAMLGQSVNFNRARELAATGDIVGAQQAVLDQIGDTVDLNNLNFHQKQKLAEASGMEFNEIQKQLSLREKFGSMNAEQQKAYDQLIASGKDLSSISKADLASQTDQVKKQQEMQSVLGRIGNQFSAIGTKLVLAFAPLAEAIMPVLEVMVGILSSMGSAIGYVIEGFKAMAPALLPIVAVLGLVYAKTIALAIMSVIKGAWMALGAIPFVGPVLALAAIAGAVGYINSQKVGDVFSPADGKTQVSTKEGGLYELSPNDDVMAAPGIFGGGLFGKAAGALFGRGGGRPDNSGVIAAINDLGEDITNLQIVVNLDGKRVTDGISKVVSRSQSNNYAERE